MPVLSMADVQVTEGNSGTLSAEFVFTLSEAASTPVTFAVITRDDTAFAGSDFVGGSGAITIPAGRTRHTVAVAVSGDAIYEAHERFTLLAGNLSGATFAGGASQIAATATIRNDDSRPSASRDNVLEISLDDGPVYIQMRPDLAPLHVARIKELAGQGFYDGLTFHRVIEGFMAQGGDPDGNGTGGSGVDLPAEFSSTPFVRGTVGMARSQSPNSADSQFFICFADARFLDNAYTVWGTVVDGMERVDTLARGEPPANPDRINQIRVVDMNVKTGTAQADVLRGSGRADLLRGEGSADSLAGAGGNDRLIGGAGNDVLDGGAGTDTAVFASRRSACSLTRLANGQVRVRSAQEGSDLLRDIEWVSFGGGAAVRLSRLLPENRPAKTLLPSLLAG